MSAGIVGVDVQQTVLRERTLAKSAAAARDTRGFRTEQFVRQQIRALVQQVFGSSSPVKQVILVPADNQTDVYSIGTSMGTSLAEMSGQNAVIVGGLEVGGEWRGPDPQCREFDDLLPLKQIAVRMRTNVWWLPIWETETKTIQSYLGKIRREFEHSILVSPTSGQANEAAAMAQYADGAILVLSAQHTRRVVARSIKQSLEDARVRLLGTVLADREFPIPETIYRRL